MTAQEYKLRLYSTLTKVESIGVSFDKKEGLDKIKERLASSLEVESNEEVAKSELDVIKQDFISLLRDTLTEVQIEFVEMEEPDSSDAELFKKYVLELKAYFL